MQMTHAIFPHTECTLVSASLWVSKLCLENLWRLWKQPVVSIHGILFGLCIVQTRKNEYFLSFIFFPIYSNTQQVGYHNILMLESRAGFDTATKTTWMNGLLWKKQHTFTNWPKKEIQFSMNSSISIMGGDFKKIFTKLNACAHLFKTKIVFNGRYNMAQWQSSISGGYNMYSRTFCHSLAQQQQQKCRKQRKKR